MKNANNTTDDHGANNETPVNPFVDVDTKKRRRIRFIRWVLIPLIVAALIAAPFVYRVSRLWGLPDIGHPFDVEEFVAYTPANEENAFTYYRTAESIFNETVADVSKDHRLVDVLDTGSQSGLTPLAHQVHWKKWLKQNQEALEIWKEGTECKDALAFDSTAILLPHQMMPAVGKTRALTSLVIAKAKLHVEKGELDEAWEWYKALFRFSRQLGHRSMQINRSVGSYLHFVSSEAIVHHWSIHDDLTVQQLTTAINDLNEAFELTAWSLDLLKNNYWTWTKLLKTTELSVEDLLEYEREPTRIELWLNNEPEQTLRLLKIQLAIELNEFEAGSSQEDVTRPSAIPKNLSKGKVNQLLDGSPYDLGIAKKRGRLQSMFAREQGRQVVLIAVLAAQRFQRQHNRFPNSIEELQAAYPEISFADPCAKGKGATASDALIHYRVDEKQILVWSVGANGENNNGNLRYTIETGFDLGYEILLDPKPETPKEE